MLSASNVCCKRLEVLLDLELTFSRHTVWAKIQSGYCMRVLGMKREEQKQCKQGLAGEKEGGTMMAAKEETDVTDTPKSSSCCPDLDGMMTILGIQKTGEKHSHNK
jgi:hypothetical protein